MTPEYTYINGLVDGESVTRASLAEAITTIETELHSTWITENARSALRLLTFFRDEEDGGLT